MEVRRPPSCLSLTSCVTFGKSFRLSAHRARGLENSSLNEMISKVHHRSNVPDLGRNDRIILLNMVKPSRL